VTEYVYNFNKVKLISSFLGKIYTYKYSGNTDIVVFWFVG
jgi:hypothetical protein